MIVESQEKKEKQSSCWFWEIALVCQNDEDRDLLDSFILRPLNLFVSMERAYYENVEYFGDAHRLEFCQKRHHDCIISTTERFKRQVQSAMTQ